MDKAAGSRIGPYELMSHLGSGGMGEVYRAKDHRLKREVAIKFLAAALMQNSDKRKRFEREAQAASALNHPNILIVHDIALENEAPYMVSELIDGESLRKIIQRGPIPVKRLIDIAVQIAAGLAAAHQAGVTHRDLKPENIMLTSGGMVKILDFGLAKLSQSDTGPNAETISQSLTETGLIYGTVPYMSPEQASGSTIDYRSDQFSFGLILYEMATGRRAFERQTVPQILSAIISEDPVPLSATNVTIPAPFHWLIERCMSKQPRERYESTFDLHRELTLLREHISEAGSEIPEIKNTRRLKPFSFVLALLAALLIAAFWMVYNEGKKAGSAAIPVAKVTGPNYTRLTFRRGAVYGARFAPDGHTIVYSAAWDGNPPELYVGVPGTADHRSLGISNAQILSISKKGELAVLVHCRYESPDDGLTGTLARLPLLGGAPRELAEHVVSADWTPDGQNLAAIRIIGSEFRLEFPLGKVLYQTPNRIRDVRVSPNGQYLAFLEAAPDSFTLALMDLHGKKVVLSRGWDYTWGLGWSANNEEIFFTAGKSILTSKEIHGVTLQGKERLILRQNSDTRFQDFSEDGRMLMIVNSSRAQMNAFHDGDVKERDMSWFDWTWSRDISSDGKTIVFLELGEGTGGNKDITYIRRVGEPAAVRLGEGFPYALSPDGRWVLATGSQNTGLRDKRLMLIPTGVGESITIRNGPIETYGRASWFPDGKRILFEGNESQRGIRLYAQAIVESIPHPITPEGFHLLGERAVSPDGKYILSNGDDKKLWIFNLEDNSSRLVPLDRPIKIILNWKNDGRGVFITYDYQTPAQIYLLNPWNGNVVLSKQFEPADEAGVTSIFGPRITPDGKSYVYTYERILSELYLVEL